MVENGRVRVIRLARKIKSPQRPFGTILGYILPGALPVDETHFRDILVRAASALGITRGLCMADFIISGKRVMLIEMTPRPGGDCLPHMLKACTGLDMLKTSLDFAAGLPLVLPDPGDFPPCMAVRIHAETEGILRHIDCRKLAGDPRVQSVHLTRKPGHRIQLPPKDYDSWLLGHVVLTPCGTEDPETEALSILNRIHVSIDAKKPGDPF